MFCLRNATWWLNTTHHSEIYKLGRKEIDIISWPCSNISAAPSSATLYNRALHMTSSFCTSLNPRTSSQGKGIPLSCYRPEFLDNIPSIIIQKKVSELKFAFEFLLHMFYSQKQFFCFKNRFLCPQVFDSITFILLLAIFWLV